MKSFASAVMVIAGWI